MEVALIYGLLGGGAVPLLSAFCLMVLAVLVCKGIAFCYRVVANFLDEVMK